GGGTGGAIAVRNRALKVNGSTFHGNFSGAGGANSIAAAGPTAVASSAVSHDGVFDFGGAILNEGPAPLAVTTSTFTGNDGDAIFSSSPQGTTSLIVTASTFTANHVGRDGG